MKKADLLELLIYSNLLFLLFGVAFYFKIICFGNFIFLSALYIIVIILVKTSSEIENRTKYS